MATKKFNIEELEQQCLEAEKAFKALHEQLSKAKKEEEEIKKAKLEEEREMRYDEVIKAYKTFEKLRGKYVDDYGYFTFEKKGEKGDIYDFFWKHCGWR